MIKYIVIIVFLLNSCTALEKQCDWRVSCESSNFFIDNIDDSNYTKIAVNSNQIYVQARIKKEKGEIRLFLDKPLDLGRGGLVLDWDNFSKEYPIARLKKINDNNYRIYWYGFYNKKRKKYIRSSQKTDLDFDENKTIYSLKRCCY